MTASKNSSFRPGFGAIRAWDSLSRAYRSGCDGIPPRGSRERASLRVQGTISSKSGTRGPVLRLVALCALLCALAGCRFEVTPDSFDLSADVGQSITESLEVRNTGDDPVELTLATSGAAVTLSTTAGVLQAGEALDIEISAECSSPGERHTDIAVTGRTGNKAIVVHVPFVLRCQDEAGAHLVSLELFQGPPTYKKDYRAGTETEPVTLARPENGATPSELWVDTVKDEDTGLWVYPSKDEAWSVDNNGFVTAIWNRRAAVAVTVFHMDDSPLPEFSASVGGAGLPVLLQETERDGDGFETVTVFDVDRHLYEREAVLDVSVKTDDGDITDRLALFGETVNPIQVTWIPIDVPEFPAQIVDAEQYMAGLEDWLPIADRITGIGPTMQYEETGVEGPGLRAHPFEALEQIRKHHVLHACAYDEIYIGYWNVQAMFDADGRAGIGGYAAVGETHAVGTSIVDIFSPPSPIALKDAHIVNAHEVGHLFDLFHVPACGREAGGAAGYPYEESALGPSRSWDFLLSEFVNRDPDTLDFMSMCGLYGGVSDFSYQLMALYRQSPQASGTCENPRDRRGAATTKSHVPVLGAKSAAVSGSPASLAVTGAVSADGIASISMAQPTDNAPWAVPGEGEFTLELLDAGGTVLHSQPVRAADVDHGHGEAFWSARVPYFESAASVVLRGSAGGVQAEAVIEADSLAADEIREKR